MAVVMPVFLDTSVILGGLIDMGASSEEPQRILAAIADGTVRKPHTAWHCCLEFFAVSTRLPVELKLDPGDAVLLIEAEVLERFSVADLPGEKRRSFLGETAAERLRGGRIYDAYIGAVARQSGARLLVTENVRHFGPLVRHGIRVLSSGEFAGEFLPANRKGG